MAGNDNAPIMAAVDETGSSLRALDWAADEARLRGRKLRVVYAFDWPLYHGIPRGLPKFDTDEVARRVVLEAAERARQRVPQVQVEALHLVGAVGPTLVEQAEQAQLVVAGSRGLSGMRAAVGSIGMQLAALAPCPVVIVPDRKPRAAAGRIVVGVDGSRAAAAAAEQAFAEAVNRRADLGVVTVFGRRAAHGFLDRLESLPPFGPFDAQEEETAMEEARRHLSESIAGQRAQHPEVRVSEKVSVGHPAEVLASESEHADLLVVGSRGLGGFTGMLLGSVSQTVLSHAYCPVMVVHAEQS